MFYKTETPICSLDDFEPDFFHGENGEEVLQVLWLDMLGAVLFLQTFHRGRPSSSSSRKDFIKIMILRNITPHVIGLYVQADPRRARFKLNDFRFAFINQIETHDVDDFVQKKIDKENIDVLSSDGLQNAVDWFAIDEICTELGLGRSLRLIRASTRSTLRSLSAPVAYKYMKENAENLINALNMLLQPREEMI
eukprot:5052906-Pleurochrysis_carterae.AAC.1